MQEVKNGSDSIDADHLRRLAQIGVALSAEKDIDRLLEKILTESRIITRADGGTLYLMSDNESELEFAFVQNESLGLSMGNAVSEMIWPPVRLSNPDGSPNHANVSAHVAITGRLVNIADVYAAQNFNCEGPGYLIKKQVIVRNPCWLFRCATMKTTLSESCNWSMPGMLRMAG